MSRLILIACTKRKALVAAAARELYWPSQLFRLSWRQAQLDDGQVAILSAKHGLVLPDDVIEPYNKTLKEMTTEERVAWAEGIRAQFTTRFGGSIAEVVFLAGSDYRSPLTPIFRSLGVRFGVHPRWTAICEQAFRGSTAPQGIHEP